MHRRLILLFAAVAFLPCSMRAIAQDPNLELLKQRVELLELKLQLAEQESERLEKECEELRKENAKLKGVAQTSPMNSKDPFEPGVVWLGDAINDDKVKTRWALSVSDRKGRSFEGVIAAINDDGKKMEFSVSGKAPSAGNGLVEFESPLMGRAKMFMRGTLKNGEIALAFSGTTPLGKKIFGSATLKPK
ncbi:hypothetical protein C5Y97_29810 [Blastopirellula marina]|nr:hypothetical protein C5Y98_29795 [Blastopirellula marina]PTL40890.1 hypothetical protein C5Y97_29810 [Blastopirellula marina]